MIPEVVEVTLFVLSLSRVRPSDLGSSALGFSRQEYWSGKSFPSPEDLPDKDWTQVSCIAGKFFTI